MKALVVLLSVSAAGFIVSTVYLAGRLHDLRTVTAAGEPPLHERSLAPAGL
jgi:hypothetical protein